MARLPVISGRDAVKAFSRAGWRAVRQHGSVVIMEKPGVKAILTLPMHAELRRGLLRSLIRDAGMTVDEFVRVL